MKRCFSCGRIKLISEFTRKPGRSGEGYCYNCYLDYMVEYRTKHPGLNRKYKYGLMPIDIHDMLTEQGDKCAVCNEKLEWDKVAVDHDHNTGKVRGLLCGRCNLALGHFRHDPRIIERAIEYLAVHS